MAYAMKPPPNSPKASADVWKYQPDRTYILERQCVGQAAA
jgi:hypothetical protein